MMRFLHNQRGFSLIELLIAVGILAIAVSGILGGIGSAAVEDARNAERLQAVILANNKMVEVQAEIQANLDKNLFPEEEEKTDKFPEPNERFTWAYKMRKVEIPLPDLGALGGGGGEGGDTSAAEDGQAQQGLGQLEGLFKLILKDVAEALREVKVTVSWQDSENDEVQTVDLTTHVINLKGLK